MSVLRPYQEIIKDIGKKTRVVNVRVDDEVAKMFRYLMKDTGIYNYAHLMRFCIAEVYKMRKERYINVDC